MKLKLLSSLVAVSVLTAFAVNAAETSSSSDAGITGEIVTPEVIEDAIKDALSSGAKEITIEVANDAALSFEDLELIAETGTDVLFKVEGGFPVTIDAESIAEALAAGIDIKGFDLKIVKYTIPEKEEKALALDIKGLTVGPEKPPFILKPSFEGELGFTIKTTVAAAVLPEYLKADKTLKVYDFSDDGKLKKVLTPTIDKQGNVTIAITGASYYLFSNETLSVYGDLNGDFYTDAEDYLLVKKVLAGWSAVADLDFSNADFVDGDGAISGTEILIFKRHISDVSGYENLGKFDKNNPISPDYVAPVTDEA